MSGHIGGAFTNVGTILVLFILLVIVACSCIGFGNIGGVGAGYGNVGGVGAGYGNVGGVGTGYGNVGGIGGGYGKY